MTPIRDIKLVVANYNTLRERLKCLVEWVELDTKLDKTMDDWNRLTELEHALDNAKKALNAIEPVDPSG